MRVFWFLFALLISLGMRPGVRYGSRSFRWAVLRACILERDGYRCRECGAVASYEVTWLEVHHKKPVSVGGSYRPGNLVSLCKGCHDKEHAKG
jgi:5-methylcytosine-specific restriction endonuclease McrA